MRELLAAAALLMPVAAQAEVKSATPAGFELERTVRVAAPPARVFTAITAIGAWWNPAHSYSGDARNLSLDPRAGGCFCEALPKSGGSVEHGRVVYAVPGEALRLQAALGPLQAEGVTGVLSWTLTPVAGGTELTQSYVVGGYIRVGPEKIAPLVDGVLGEQLDRLKAYAETPAPARR